MKLAPSHIAIIAISAIIAAGTAALVLLGADRFFAPPSVPLLSQNAVALKDTLAPVPAGWFVMGSEQGESDEKPEHKVWLDSFQIDLFPVTNSQYARFLLETHRKAPLYWNDPKCNHPNQPVVGVAWADAMEYCAWRSAKEGGTFRLPTEAEWEKAARGPDKRKYPWGNQAPDKKRAVTEISEKMPAVGMCELGKSPYGVSDLVGNVWNWCGDWYDPGYYAAAPDSNPKGPAGPTRKGRAVRGGNWVFLGCCSGTPEYALRLTRRNAFHERIQKKSLGFRCVKAIGVAASLSIPGAGTP
jgi:formylglycine-generating enzyme required for sulfatase activity